MLPAKNRKIQKLSKQNTNVAKRSKMLLEALQSTKMSGKGPVITFSGHGKS